MSDELTIITNNVPRDVLDAHELTVRERAEFDYIDWDAIEAGRDSASFVRYKGYTYDLGDVESTRQVAAFRGWDGFVSDSFFSGVLFRYCDDYEQIVCGRYYS
jgi:hypothetical protein